MHRSELTWRWTGQKWVGDSSRMCTCWFISVCRLSRARFLSQQINSIRTMGRMTITPTITVATTRWCSVINLELSTCSAENECKIYWFPPFFFTCWRVAPILTIVLWTRWNIHRAVPVLEPDELMVDGRLKKGTIMRVLEEQNRLRVLSFLLSNLHFYSVDDEWIVNGIIVVHELFLSFLFFS